MQSRPLIAHLNKKKKEEEEKLQPRLKQILPSYRVQ
jgi:hypothetical protein